MKIDAQSLKQATSGESEHSSEGSTLDTIDENATGVARNLFNALNHTLTEAGIPAEAPALKITRDQDHFPNTLTILFTGETHPTLPTPPYKNTVDILGIGDYSAEDIAKADTACRFLSALGKDIKIDKEAIEQMNISVSPLHPDNNEQPPYIIDQIKISRVNYGDKTFSAIVDHLDMRAGLS